MNKKVVESRTWIEESIEENFESLRDDLFYALRFYEEGNLEGCDALLQNVIKGASLTMALITPLIILRDDETMRAIIEGGIDE